MRFDKIIGTIDPALISLAEEKMTRVFLELGSGIDNVMSGSANLGGDPLIFALLVPAVHIATLNVPTAATNGKFFFWNPHFLASASSLRLRLTCYHESSHALLMHPRRRGNRHLQLWNICADYIANGWIMEDLLIRFLRQAKTSGAQDRLRAEAKMKKTFVEGLGNYCTLEQCIAHLKDPDGLIPGMEQWKPEPVDPELAGMVLPAPDEDRELTDKEKRLLSKGKLHYTFFYADPSLTEEMKSPERIYNLLHESCPKCPACGKLGMVPPQKGAEGKGDGAGQTGEGEEGAEPGVNCSSPQGKSGCGTCGEWNNALDFGETLDTHLETIEDQDEMIKRFADAVQTAKAMAGNVPAQLIEELGQLSKPRISFPDFIRTQLSRARNGNSRNDFGRFRSKPLAFGMLIPKKKGRTATGIVLLDTSGSMSTENIALCISQLQNLDERAELTIVPCDSMVRWKSAIKIRRCNPAELFRIKVEGRGGTQLFSFFEQYQKEIGAADFLIILTDGLLDKKDIEKMQMTPPKVPVYWVIAGAEFIPPFGQKFDLLDN